MKTGSSGGSNLDHLVSTFLFLSTSSLHCLIDRTRTWVDPKLNCISPIFFSTLLSKDLNLVHQWQCGSSESFRVEDEKYGRAEPCFSLKNRAREREEEEKKSKSESKRE